jgi:hypothetical protein
MSFAGPVPPAPVSKPVSREEAGTTSKGIYLKRRDVVKIRFGTKLVTIPARIRAIVNALDKLAPSSGTTDTEAVEEARDCLSEQGRNLLDVWWQANGSEVIMNMALARPDACIFIGDTRTRLPPEFSKLMAARDAATKCDAALDAIDDALYKTLNLWWDDHCAILFDDIIEQLTSMDEIV